MRKINKKTKKNGSASLIVIAALIIISLFSALMINILQNDIYQLSAYSLQVKAYYLADEAASATVSAFLKDDDEALINKDARNFPMHDDMDHKDGEEIIGTSSIDVTKEQHHYYDSLEYWLVIRITTKIPDTRASRLGEEFEYKLTVMVLVSNPLVQLYDVDPDSLD